MAVQRLSKYNSIITGSAILLLAFPAAILPGLLLSLPPLLILSDALALAASLFLLGFFTLSMHEYGMPDFVQLLLFFLGVAGIPPLILYVFFDDATFHRYLPSLPLRLFFTLLVCVLFALQKKIRKQSQTPVESNIADQSDNIAKEQPAPGQNYPENILVRSGNALRVIPIADLLFISADGDYVRLVTEEGFWLKEETMKHLQETLPASQFVRVHRSFIVNTSKISRIERCGQQQYLFLTNGESIRISATGYTALKDALGI